MLPGGRAGAGSGRSCSFKRTARCGSGRFPQDAEVSPSGTFRSGRGFERCVRPPLGGRRLPLDRQGSSVPDRVGKSQEVVRAGLLGRGGHGQAKNLPAPGNGEGISVLPAQVVAVGLRISRQWTKDRRGVRVDIRQGGYR
jgi:hypothetical protein